MLFSRSSSFSLIQVNVDIKIKSKERIGFLICCYLFFSKSPSGYAIYRRNAQVLEMQNLYPAYMKGWTYVLTPYGRFCQNQNFLEAFITKFSLQWCAATHALREREHRYNVGIPRALNKSLRLSLRL